MSRSYFPVPAIALLRKAQGDFFATDIARAATTCDVLRVAAVTTNDRFQPSDAYTAVYAGVPCVVKPVKRVVRSDEVFADRIEGRALINVWLAASFLSLVVQGDRLAVHGGATYEVVGPPYPSGPQSPKVIVPCAAVTPLATNS